MSKNKQTADFASVLTELEALATRLEDNDNSLEHSLKDFERGVQLIRQAQRSLQEAEQKVRMLLDKDGDPVAAPLADDQDPNSDEEDL